MIETKFTKTLYKAIRKLNLDKEELKQMLLCLYINGCSSEDCARLFGADEEKIKRILESERVYGYKACNNCGKLKDRKKDYYFLKNQNNTICKDCKSKYGSRYYENNKEKKQKYHKEYHKNNIIKIKKQKQEYQKNNKEKIREYNKKYHKQYYVNNKEKKQEYYKEYQKNNKKKIRELKKQYIKNNKEELLEYNRKYYENNKEERLKYHKKYHQQNASIEQVQSLSRYETVSGNQIRCKYCGRWMIPTVLQVRNRLKGIKEIGDGNYIYCSDECKQECPTYGQLKYPKGFKVASSREVDPTLRLMVLERDDYTCQKCGKFENVNLHCHHKIPVINSPIESNDVNNCITLCKECHQEVHKMSGCGYGELRCKKKDAKN